MSATGIESQNIVGYQTKSVRKNLSQQVCTFDQIGVTGGALDIQKLLPVDGEGEVVGDGEVHIQIKSALGALVAQYGYYKAGEWDAVAGWYDDGEGGTEELADLILSSGEAFQVYASCEFEFRYSGEVNMAETDVPFRKNLSVQANIRPTSVDVQDIKPIDNEGEVIGSGEVHIQITSPLGALITQYGYYKAGEWDAVAGWYDDGEGGTEELADFTLSAGEGFKVYAGQAGYLRFPEL